MNSHWPFEPLRPLGYDVIVADPPWLVKMRSKKGEGKAPQAHYDCMTIPEIKALPVGHLARRDAWLFLWTSAPLFDQAMDVLKAWDFTYCTRTSWLKRTKNDKRSVGPGYVVRTEHEDILIGKIGEPRCNVPFPSIFPGVRREHSRKPDEFWTHLHRFAPDAYIAELFTRETRPLVDGWGNEATKFDQKSEGGIHV